MSKLCIFPHYYDQPYIPQYVCIYTNELLNYFDSIIIVTNQRDIQNRKEVESQFVSILEVENQGYDFGMFYKGFQTIKHEKFETIACINDSNVIFGNLKFLFEWASQQKVDFWGLADANIKPSFSTHLQNYHIQSHFLVFNKQAILLLNQYFEQLDIEALFSINEPKTVKKRIINDWEIGLSQYFIKNKLSSKAYFSVNELEKTLVNNGDYNKEATNISLDLYAEIIQFGAPILKKKIITSAKPKHLFTYKNNWKRLIEVYGDKNLNLKALIKELAEIRNRHYSNRILK